MAVESSLEEARSSTANPIVLEATGLHKRYGPVHAVRSVDLSLRAGEALALCGENGAGKSTVFKILAGETPADGGRVELSGKPYAPNSPAAAVASGVSMIHQEFNILPNVSVAENVYLGRMDGFRRFGLIDWKGLYEAADELLGRLHIRVSPSAAMRTLSPSSQKMVECARALSTKPRVLLLDEVTASLDHDDADTLHELLGRLKAEGVGIVYVSHRLQEIFRACERVLVMKDGAEVGTLPADELDEARLSALMVGRDVAPWHRAPQAESAPLMLRLDRLSGPGFEDVSLDVHRGQIVTLAGLAGSGADEVLETVFGVRQRTGGAIVLDGGPYEGRSIPDAISAGIGMVPKERAVEGLIDALDIRTNIGLASLPRIAQSTFVDHRLERSIADDAVRQFRIKARAQTAAVRELSGGNKQKVLLAKWFATRPKLMLLNNPTRGVDVGVKFEIYELLQSLREQTHLAVLMASEDMAEVVRISDVVVTIRHGRVSGRFEGEAITETNLINAML